MSEQNDVGSDEQVVPEGPSAEERAATAEKQLAFVKAGIDYETGMGALMYDSYSGETTVEAVAEKAKHYGLLDKPQVAESPQVTPVEFTDDEKASTDMRRSASTGAAADDGTQDPRVTGRQVFEESLRTKSREDAMVDHLRSFVAAAKAGDGRVLVQD